MRRIITRLSVVALINGFVAASPALAQQQGEAVRSQPRGPECSHGLCGLRPPVRP